MLRRVSAAVFVNYLLSNLGYYTLLPVLPLLLRRIAGEQAWFVGTALFTLAFSVRASCLFVGAVLHRTPVRAATSGGLLTAAAGFGLLAGLPGRAGILGCLALAGFGISVNTLMARAYVAMALPTPGARNTAFSAVQVAVNLAAAVGPIAANLLFSSGRYRASLLVVAGLYAIGAAVVAVVVPGRLRPADQGGAAPMGLGGVRTIATDRPVRRVAMVSVAGWFLYGQLFSALALHIGAITSQPLLRSSFFTLNAALIVVAQIPVSAYATRRLDAGTPPVRFLVAGVTAFGAAFAVLAVAGGGLAGTFAAVAVFSLAETVFTPFVSTAFAQISDHRPVVEAFNLMQIVMSVGESLGAFAGGALFSLALAQRAQPAYWLALCGTAVAVVVGYRLTAGRPAPVPGGVRR